MKLLSIILFITALLSSLLSVPASAAEFKVDCTSFDDCMSKGNMIVFTF